MKCLVYLDDVLVLLRPTGLARGKVAFLREVLTAFGFTVNEKKSDFTLRWRRIHLGVEIDLHQRAFRVDPAKLTRLRGMSLALAKEAAAHKRYVFKRDLAKMVGLAVAVSPALPGGRFHLLPLYDSINSVDGWRASLKVRVTNSAYRRLREFWSKLQLTDCVCRWDPTPPEELWFTDSSDFGYGAHLSLPDDTAMVAGSWGPFDSQQHITYKELKVVQVSLELLALHLQHRSVALFSDSSTTV